MIKKLDIYYNSEFEGVFDNIEKRLEKLFMIKDKWTFNEIKNQLIEFCDPDISNKFDLWLSKNTRTIKEANPFQKTV